MRLVGKYIFNILIAIDQLINTVFGGDYDMTISGRLGNYYKDTWTEKMIDKIYGEGHCEREAARDLDLNHDRIID